MREPAANPPARGEALEPALMGLTVRDAILAAAELISDVPIPRSGTAGDETEDETEKEVQGHG
ncbi:MULTISPECIES: hypothetical protein [unclassified Amycolatopsis]|uniref:hypothetical protein n=1 Tax=unclassified Amycolatopsis TaxID=2618356 RepID=UPI001FF5B856|nr:hypothetical protein [Amycolatopsis sp. FBCC-B4732]UOX87790.1 hypothetical protein MUY14_39765 [Amycolatopsis sp. FBCC-B4732]